MNGLGKATVASAVAVGILVLIPIVGYVWDPTRSEEMMGGRLIVWGLAWAAAAGIAAATLAILVIIGLLRRMR